MKRFITLLLMVTTLLTFTQKVMAVAPLLESESQVMNHCGMENMNMGSVECDTDMSTMENCQISCEMMTVISILHFIEHQQLVSFQVSQLHYTSLTTSPAYHYSEILYRPPFFS
jgi:hypothetical protein